MIAKIKFYDPKADHVSRISYTYESLINVNIDDIVVVNSKYGLNFGVVTEILNNSTLLPSGKILCVVPTEETYI